MRQGSRLGRRLAAGSGPRPGSLPLEDGARIGVVGGGPAGSLFALFLLRMAETAGLKLDVTIHDPKRFDRPGAGGCNQCGGVISESLVQMLATEGILLERPVLRRGIDSYMLHMDAGHARLTTPTEERRIAAVYRGSGPRLALPVSVASFDGYLLDLARARGAQVVHEKVETISLQDGRPRLATSGGTSAPLDLLVVATGVNSPFLERVREAFPAYRPPRTARTAICEYHLGREQVESILGDSMHVFLLDMPGLEFAAIVPKGELATLCLLGHDIDAEFVRRFLARPEVRELLGAAVESKPACLCFPNINVGGAAQPWADRMVVVGDSGVARLYKDGIGAAYRTAKAAAVTAAFQGVGAVDFARHYRPTVRRIERDNALGRIVFTVAGLIQRSGWARRGLLRMVLAEQRSGNGAAGMSSVLWDMFTGSAPYAEVLARTLKPAFDARLALNLAAAAVPPWGGDHARQALRRP